MKLSRKIFIPVWRASPPLEGGEAVPLELERKLEMLGRGFIRYLYNITYPTPKSKISTLPQGAGRARHLYIIRLQQQDVQQRLQ